MRADRGAIRRLALGNVTHTDGSYLSLVMLREGGASSNLRCRGLLDRPPSRTMTIMGACLLPLVSRRRRRNPHAGAVGGRLRWSCELGQAGTAAQAIHLGPQLARLALGDARGAPPFALFEPGGNAADDHARDHQEEGER